jgi:hypothetical protein
MTDYDWPDDLVPYAQQFYLQPNTGGTESPFNRKTKVYALSAPRWICSMSFRGGYNGESGLKAYGPRLDALIAKLEGRTNRIRIWDFRRDGMRSPLWPRSASNLSAVQGATSMTITTLAPGTPVYAGDYIGGDGRSHIILDDVYANGSGQAVVSFKPPLAAAIGAGAATFSQAGSIFRLVNDDAGQNVVQVGEAQTMTLDFVEDI